MYGKNKGNIYLDSAEYEEALKCFDASIKENPKDPAGYYNKGVGIVWE